MHSAPSAPLIRVSRRLRKHVRRGQGRKPAQIPSGVLVCPVAEPEWLHHVRTWKICRHGITGQIIHFRVLDGYALDRRVPTGREYRNPEIKFLLHRLPSAPFGKLLWLGPLPRPTHPAAARTAQAGARRVHDRKQVPTPRQDAIAHVANDVTVAAVLCGLKVTRPCVVT